MVAVFGNRYRLNHRRAVPYTVISQGTKNPANTRHIVRHVALLVRDLESTQGLLPTSRDTVIGEGLGLD